MILPKDYLSTKNGIFQALVFVLSAIFIGLKALFQQTAFNSSS